MITEIVQCDECNKTIRTCDAPNGTVSLYAKWDTPKIMDTISKDFCSIACLLAWARSDKPLDELSREFDSRFTVVDGFNWKPTETGK